VIHVVHHDMAKHDSRVRHPFGVFSNRVPMTLFDVQQTGSKWATELLPLIQATNSTGMCK